jgi:saccharopine dehydrogenase (NAD+, L-lysine-forming)
MGKVLLIGAGGVGSVVAHKMASLLDVFSEIILASRTRSKCDVIAERIGKNRIKTAQIDADNVPELVKLIKSFSPDIVVNVALPYQDLHIMDACLETGVAYLDTANYEPLEEAKFEYSWLRIRSGSHFNLYCLCSKTSF